MTIEPSSDAINVPSVVFESATHLYESETGADTAALDIGCFRWATTDETSARIDIDNWFDHRSNTGVTWVEGPPWSMAPQLSFERFPLLSRTLPYLTAYFARYWSKTWCQLTIIFSIRGAIRWNLAPLVRIPVCMRSMLDESC
jgi:hypothetical protein